MREGEGGRGREHGAQHTKARSREGQGDMKAVLYLGERQGVEEGGSGVSGGSDGQAGRQVGSRL